MGLDTYVGGAFLVVGCSLLSVVGLLIMRRLIDFDRLRASHEVGGYLLSVVGTLYAVLLGLVVVDAMQRFQDARAVTEKESNCLADVYILSSSLPEAKRLQIQDICVKYANQVITTEWSNMREGKYCSRSSGLAISLMRSLMDFEPKTENQKAIYPQLVSDASEMWQSRRVRVNIATNGIPPIEWVTLIVGGVITVFFTFFFGLENLRLQIAMTSMVTMLISLNMFLVLLFGYPFSGDLSISTESFHLSQCIFQNKVE